ncbi:MAG: autotransporter-associated beta strand repeat-containing protein [Phycisphaerae bacterium]|nr:autotransporter-associated beta strand repeat-containing protein [Phycisphaerae bacterium]MDW8262513.1 autotransporter-associated beta strand repeat-containing protein [Phycisphaerales bacterium]
MKRSQGKTNQVPRLAATAALACWGAGYALAANGTWVASSNTSWNSAAAWLSGTIPGNNSGTLGTSTDVATFTSLGLSSASTLPIVVGVDPGRNIHSMIFDNFTIPETSTNAYRIGTVGGNPLYLSNGGVIRMTDTVVSSNPSNAAATVLVDIDAPMVLTGTTYTFDAGAGSVNNSLPGLRLNGPIIAAAGAPTTLIFDGVHGGPGSSRAENQSQITDGPNGAIVSVVKNGPGTWEMNQDSSAPNTYSGDTIINAGVLRSSTASGFNGLGGFSPNSHYIVNAGGLLRNSVAGSTIKALTINAGGSMNVSTAASTTLNFNTGTFNIPAIHLNYVTAGAGTFNSNGPFTFLGTLPEAGGIKLSCGSLTGHANLGTSGSVLDIGSTLRLFDIGKGDPNNAYDLRIFGPVVGGGPDGGIVKTGPGLLRFESSSVGFTGKLEIRQGVVQARVDNAFTGLPRLEITGGFLNVLGSAGSNTFSFGPVKMTKGGITAGSSITSTVRAPSFLLEVAAGDTVAVGAVLADRDAPATLTKTGLGVATLTGNNTYSGGTTVAGGELHVNTNSEDIIINPGAPGANITAGKLVFDYTGGTSPANQIVPILDAGYDVNFSTGRLRSSAATSSLGLGYRDDGISKFTVAFTRYGDANTDLVVDLADFSLLAANFNQTGTWSRGDFNYDFSVDLGDFSQLAANFNQAAPSGADLPRAAAVPDPASAGLLAACAFLLSRRRMA